ncbi:MAG: hypothetical protein HUK20_07045, partial [Fibrobacter sp.]|nr:hypothetical protein [Fibrobacter sp.]
MNISDPDLEAYIDMLENDIKNNSRKYDELKKEIDEDLQHIGSRQEREILKNYREFLNLKSEADQRKIQLPKGSKEAERLGAEYERRIKAGLNSGTYENIYRNFDTLKAEIEANVKAQERLRAENKIEEYKEAIKTKFDAKKVKIITDKYDKLNSIMEENRAKREEAAAINRIKELRKNLVKRTMRRVPFTTVDYNTAKTLIAIQRVFEPNLRGGINKWIGTEGVYARDVWSAWKTDADSRETIMQRLSNAGKTDIIKLLEDTKTADDFNKWTKKQRQALERAMPKQDYMKELKLDEWKKERDGSLQLDIKEVTKTRWTTDENGNRVQEEYKTAEFGDDIKDMIETALGPDLASSLIYRPFAEWTTEELEDLAARVNKLYKDGRDILKAKREAEKAEAKRIQEIITNYVRNTGITINEDDSDEVKKKKQEKIDRILGVNPQIPGTEAYKSSRKQTTLNRILHGYHDANMRRVARILDNWSEGTNTALLYWRENECYNSKQRAVETRNNRIETVAAANNISFKDLAKTYEFDLGMKGKTVLTADNILMMIAAQMNNEDYIREQIAEGLTESECEEDSAFQAIKYGNLIHNDERNAFKNLDNAAMEAEKARLEELHNAELTGDEERIKELQKVDAERYQDMTPGTSRLKALANERFNKIMAEAGNELKEMYLPLIDAIRADYAENFDRMNRASIDEFNMPVWREKRYIPLIRLSSSGDTHEARVRQDLLGNMAGTGKAGVEKGFTKKRIEISPLYQAPVELGLYRTWADSVDRTEHFIAYAGYVRELNRVYDMKSGMIMEIENRYGKAMKDYIDSYIKEVANPARRPAPEGLDKVARSLRGNTAPAYLAWKASSIIKQAIESPAPFMQFITPLEYTKACIDIASSSEIRESISQKSMFMNNRTFDPIVDLVNEEVERNLNKPGYALKKFQQTGMKGLEWIDWACVAPGWLAVYRKELNALNGEYETRYEERVAELTKQQQS